MSAIGSFSVRRRECSNTENGIPNKPTRAQHLPKLPRLPKVRAGPVLHHPRDRSIRSAGASPASVSEVHGHAQDLRRARRHAVVGRGCLRAQRCRPAAVRAPRVARYALRRTPRPGWQGHRCGDHCARSRLPLPLQGLKAARESDPGRLCQQHANLGSVAAFLPDLEYNRPPASLQSQASFRTE